LEKANTWLRQSLHYEFLNERLLQTALTHRSAVGDNNERFEFLGDAVLQLVISEKIFLDRPDASEGRLSRLRSSLVKDTTLAEIAVELGVGEHLILGAGEKKSGGHRRASILADAVEAIFAAIYVDAGFDAGKAHKQFFEVSCTISDLGLTTRGNGTTRRDAEQDAADAMLASIESQDKQ